ncbi:MAG: BatA domain-containing protein [Bacteroidetes bacterium]|nr:BatA domain-containing protein [Bacteroidota bacterium]
MSFLYPAFLFALGALAIPIIIHLFNFRRYKTVYFSNTKFLREVKEKTDSRSRLKHLLILLCRLLAITFLVFAFAQPYIKRGAATETAGKKTVSVFIDNSFSMGQTQRDAPLVELAKRKAAEVVSAYGDDDLFQPLTNDFEASQQRLIDKQEMLNQIREVKISPATRNLSEIVNRQREALEKGSGAKLAYVISDFQKNFCDFSGVRTDTTVRLSMVPLRSAEASNVYIDTCWFQSPVQVKGQPSMLLVRLVNNSGKTIDAGRLTFKINDQIKAITDFSIDPNGIKTDTISYTVTEGGWNRGELSIIDHPITFDDTYYLTYEVAEQEAVMVINESVENDYLNALFGRNDFFKFRNVAFNQLKYDEILQQRLVILNGVKQPGSGLAAQLSTFLEQGGSVCIFPDATADVSSYNSFLATLGADAMGSFLPAEKTVTAINRNDELFLNVFQHLSENLALPRVTASFSFSSRTNSSADGLLTFNDGSNLLTKYSAGKGILYVWAVPLDKQYGDLPLSPLFAPIMYNIAIVRAYAPANAYVIGMQNEASAPVDVAGSEQVFQLKGGSVEFIPAQRRVGAGVTVYFDNNVRQSGFYELTDANNQSRAWFALNYDRRESDLTFLTDDQLKSDAATARARVISNPDRDLAAMITGQKAGLPLWKVAVMLALFFVFAEIALLKFWK